MLHSGVLSRVVGVGGLLGSERPRYILSVRHRSRGHRCACERWRIIGYHLHQHTVPVLRQEIQQLICLYQQHTMLNYGWSKLSLCAYDLACCQMNVLVQGPIFVELLGTRSIYPRPSSNFAKKSPKYRQNYRSNIAKISPNRNCTFSEDHKNFNKSLNIRETVGERAINFF